MIIKKGDIFVPAKDIYVIHPSRKLYNELFDRFYEKNNFVSFISTDANTYEEEENLKYLYQMNKEKFLIQIQGEKNFKKLLKNHPNLKYKKIIVKNTNLLPVEFVFSRFVKIYEEINSSYKLEKDEWDNVIFNYSKNNQQKFSIKKNETIIFIKLKNLNNYQEVILIDINLLNFKINKNYDLENLQKNLLNHEKNKELNFSI